ncbi:MAG: ABC transporter ATP-binding protein [Bacillus sp. (in: firmicutes)]
MALVVENLKKRFSENIVLDGIDVTIKQGEFVCILGKSGCGKSTLLNLLAGFTKPTEGSIKVKGEIIDKPSKQRGLVFQEHALFPWYTVLENISFGPIVQGLGKKEAKEKAKKYLKLIHLEEYENHYPSQLSGGMKQRVGIARALAGEPDFLLMDEPFGALDVFTKEHMRNELITIWSELKPTIIFITHDISEAIYLADRIIVLKKGTIAEEYNVHLNRPRQYYDEKFGKLAAEIEKTLM